MTNPTVGGKRSGGHSSSTVRSAAAGYKSAAGVHTRSQKSKSEQEKAGSDGSQVEK